MALGFSKCVMFLFLSFFLLVSNSNLVGASPAPPTLDLFRRDNTTDSEVLNCTTDVSGDYYGFGVRLGVYFAWLSSYFANLLLPSEISGSLDTNTIFLLALIASLFQGTVAGEIFQIDGLIIMQLCSGFLFSSLSIWGYRTSYFHREGVTAIRHFGRFGTHCRLALATAISIYGAWFWWEGLEDGLVIAEDPRCQKIFTWFFGIWPVSGGIHIFYIFVTICCAIYYGTMCVTAALAGAVKLLRVGWKGEMNFHTGFSARELTFLFNLFRVFNLFWIVFCVSMIEMTLSRNHMVNTLARNGEIAYPAQLLPLIAGALSFVRVLWLIYVEWKETRLAAIRTSDASFEAPRDAKPIKNKSTLHDYLEFSIDFVKKFFLPARSGLTPTYQNQQLDLPYTLRPWQHRYMVALLPWLSTLEIGKIAVQSNELADIEQSATETRKDFTEDNQEIAHA